MYCKHKRIKALFTTCPVFKDIYKYIFSNQFKLIILNNYNIGLVYLIFCSIIVKTCGSTESKLMASMNVMKSRQTTERVYVRFVNKTTRVADVLWVDFEGVPVRYSTLKPDAHIDIDTFAYHPWIFKDHNTKDKLSVHNEFYYVPPSWKELLLARLSVVPENVPAMRIQVLISLPVYTLRERCLQVVRDHCTSLNLSREMLNQLKDHLPMSVYEDLIERFLMRDGIYM